jgi:phage terminase small subunit
MTELTPKQARFVQEYLIDLNATQAAIRAGYSAKTAEQIGHQLLKKTSVAEAVAQAQAKLSEKTGITVERVLEEYAKLGFANMQDYIRVTDEGDAYVNLSEMSRDQAAAIAEVKVEDFKDGRGEDARDVRRVTFKLSDKRAALDSIAKHLGMFTEKHEHSGNVEIIHTFKSNI